MAGILAGQGLAVPPFNVEFSVLDSLADLSLCNEPEGVNHRRKILLVTGKRAGLSHMSRRFIASPSSGLLRI